MTTATRTRILAIGPQDAFRIFERLAAEVTDERTARELGELARDRAQFLAARRDDKPRLERSLGPLAELERRWYASLKAGEPDYGVYAAPAYLAELAACWVRYSRYYLREVSGPKRGILAQLGEPGQILDLGAGLGWTSSALADMFPSAEVTATELGSTLQGEIARKISAQDRFKVVENQSELEHTDVVFASEYFEHFEDPLEELETVLALEPEWLILANTFKPSSIGHFDHYRVGDEFLEPAPTSKAFDAELRQHGFTKVETRIWNQRPTPWRR